MYNSVTNPGYIWAIRKRQTSVEVRYVTIKRLMNFIASQTALGRVGVQTILVGRSHPYYPKITAGSIPRELKFLKMFVNHPNWTEYK